LQDTFREIENRAKSQGLSPKDVSEPIRKNGKREGGAARQAATEERPIKRSIEGNKCTVIAIEPNAHQDKGAPKKKEEKNDGEGGEGVFPNHPFVER